ncbi:hypothetical protein P1J78_23980 [Psychromarinibacter sp. C21-152]|uniref:Cytochrome c domain-containing protein n=1 Tax=Psychromarinibacter sediminicola TaxID=3033385 RepID=A0AAE3NY34_9RHOB|nr:hypothetical protein [Psychromarinibacter sediminicola]MDF0603779.1 hypothetical protein [Psychromarinibacter sediminicola]
MPVRLSLFAAFLLALAGPAAAWPQFANETGAECAFCHQGPPANKVFTQQGQEYRQYLINQGRLPGCKKIPAYDANGNYLGEIEQCS